MTASVGVIKTYDCDNDDIAAVKDCHFKETINETDRTYVYRRCVVWLLKKVSRGPKFIQSSDVAKGQGPLSVEDSLKYEMYFGFKATATDWIDNLEFYVSDKCDKDFYQLNPNNSGK
jgi:hypothetical protein